MNSGYALQERQLNPPLNAQQVREIPVLEAQANRLNGHAQEIDLAAQRLAVLADRILGSQPETASKSEPKGPAPDSALWKLNGAHEWMEAARLRLMRAIERLEVL